MGRAKKKKNTQTENANIEESKVEVNPETRVVIDND